MDCPSGNAPQPGASECHPWLAQNTSDKSKREELRKDHRGSSTALHRLYDLIEGAESANQVTVTDSQLGCDKLPHWERRPLKK